MDEQKQKVASAIFTQAIKDMVAKNESSYNLSRWGRNRYERVKEYSLEEIEKIIDSGSVEAQIALSRNYFTKGGFYQRLLLHYATLLKYTGLLIPNPSFGKNLSESYITKKYNAAVNFIDNADLPELFTHIAIKTLRDGCYYGVIQEVTDRSVSILDLPIIVPNRLDMLISFLAIIKGSNYAGTGEMQEHIRRHSIVVKATNCLDL